MRLIEGYGHLIFFNYNEETSNPISRLVVSGFIKVRSNVVDRLLGAQKGASEL
jgi:hypothetical protein